ncbi:MAG: SEC-C metal-binding domain-containing protein [Amphritea sp.]|nr:SEC-C metal-binding domain-containing protein [Amphritea sp.]
MCPQKTGRNDPSQCGSGKKFKKCCMTRNMAPVASMSWQKCAEQRVNLFLPC